jgi:hypothetical protein
MNDWIIDPAWLGQMNAAVWNGRTFSAILQASMQRLISSFAEPLRHEANVLTNANAPVVQYVFDGNQMARHLRDGHFKYNQLAELRPIAINVPTPQLVVRGPRPGNVGTTINGRAGINKDWIEINFPRLIGFANGNPGWFPNNAIGDARLEVIVGKTMLHEMMHNHGFQHPDHPGTAYNPAEVYWRTFPEVAEQAYFRLNQALFPGLNTILNLTGNRNDTGYCGTNG